MIRSNERLVGFSVGGKGKLEIICHQMDDDKVLNTRVFIDTFRSSTSTDLCLSEGKIKCCSVVLPAAIMWTRFHLCLQEPVASIRRQACGHLMVLVI